MQSVEVPIQYWDETQNDTFWVYDAMKTAVGLWHLKNIELLEVATMPNLEVVIDRERGVVTARTVS